MGFLKDLKLVKEYIENNNTVAELNEQIKWKTETINKISTDMYRLQNEVEKLTEKKLTLEQQLESLGNGISDYQKQVQKYFSLEIREVIKILIEEKDYEFYKLDIEKEVPKESDYNGTFYFPISIKRVIDMHIQELAAIENFDFAYLRQILYEVNGAWTELYESIGSKEREHLYKSNASVKLLMSFMMLRKKGDSEKVNNYTHTIEVENEIDKMFEEEEK